MTKKWGKKPYTEHIICKDCGYHNQPWNVDKYGTCRGCGKVLNDRIRFKREMFKKLRLWKGGKKYD